MLGLISDALKDAAFNQQNPGNGIETTGDNLPISNYIAFNQQNPGNGIETLALVGSNIPFSISFQSTESRQRD